MLTLRKDVAPMTIPYTKQSINYGQEKIPSSIECGGFFIKSAAALSRPSPEVGGKLVN
jgi:hypothetical protein